MSLFILNLYISNQYIYQWKPKVVVIKFKLQVWYSV